MRGGGYTLAGRWGGWGVNILEDARHRIGLLQSNLSTLHRIRQCSESVTFDRILLFSKVALKMPQKNFTSKFFCFLLTLSTFTSVFKDKKLLRSHNTFEMKVFLHFFFCLLMEGSGSSYGSVKIVTYPDPGGPKTYCTYRSEFKTLVSAARLT